MALGKLSFHQMREGERNAIYFGRIGFGDYTNVTLARLGFASSGSKQPRNRGHAAVGFRAWAIRADPISGG